MESAGKSEPLNFALRFISHVPNKGGSRVPLVCFGFYHFGQNCCIPPIVMLGDLSNGVAAMGSFLEKWEFWHCAIQLFELWVDFESAACSLAVIIDFDYRPGSVLITRQQYGCAV